jgi:hypothetical protein
VACLPIGRQHFLWDQACGVLRCVLVISSVPTRPRHAEADKGLRGQMPPKMKGTELGGYGNKDLEAGAGLAGACVNARWQGPPCGCCFGVFRLWHEGMLGTDWRQSGPGILRNRARGWFLEVPLSQEPAASYAGRLPFGHKLHYSQRYSPALVKSQPPGCFASRRGIYRLCTVQARQSSYGHEIHA